MSATRKQLDRAKIAQAKHLYESTRVPLDEIAALLGISRRTLSDRASEWGWKKRNARAPNETDRRRGSADARPPVASEATPPGDAEAAPQASQDRAALAARIQAAAEREIAAVERILAVLGASDPAETEGAARTLASLARTLRELVHLERRAAPTEPVDDEHRPRDLDEFRRALARRLEELIAEAKAVCPDESAVD